MSKRSADTLVRRVRDELRAEGPDGAGYSDFIILEAINAALDDLSEIFTIRDTVSFSTVAGTNTYDLTGVIGTEIFTIVRITYDGDKIDNLQIDDFLDTTIKDSGSVRKWLLWGTHLTLVGEVEASKTVQLWVARAPSVLSKKGDTPDTPRYADEAIVSYAMSVCYRESKDFERANYYNRIYTYQKNDLLRRSVPQGQKSSLPKMSESYGGPFRSKVGFVRSDTNPGGS